MGHNEAFHSERALVAGYQQLIYELKELKSEEKKHVLPLPQQIPLPS
jgi:hypothetical protein